MHSQACEPCGKRKVRCDRKDPCSNCQRRKQDRCIYPEASPGDRIKKLETLVRALGGDPDVSSVRNRRLHATASIDPTDVPTLSHSSQGQDASSNNKSKDPVIVEEDGQQHYLESRVWLEHGHRTPNPKNPLLRHIVPYAFQSVICSRQSPDLYVAVNLKDKAQTLWRVFRQRVNPLMRISFEWELARLESATTALGTSDQPLDDAEGALVSSIYLASVVSLSDVECIAQLHESKPTLLPQFQTSCEEALAKTSLLCMKNIMSLKAMAIYLLVSIDRLNTQSLWSIMGLTIRNAETLGIHRDGTLLGLSPVETEERRRLWWQLQYLDLILALRLGITPSTLKADWDVRLPLNVEDSDLTPNMTNFPEERKGLTSMAYCLFTAYVLDQQRQYHANKGRFELSWSTNQSVPTQTKENFIDQLEDGLNQKFLQYCDPIKPLHILLHLMGRALICVFRQRILLPVGEMSERMIHENRGPLLESSLQLLEYAIIMHSHQLLKDFGWITQNGFPWPACKWSLSSNDTQLTDLVMVVLVEASQESDMAKCQRIWSLLSDLYAATASLFDLAEDRRRSHAAELVVAAWKSCQSKGTVSQTSSKPDFVSSLEERLAEYTRRSTLELQVTNTNNNNEQSLNYDAAHNFLIEQDANRLFNLDFQDIDWSFWNSID